MFAAMVNWCAHFVLLFRIFCNSLHHLCLSSKCLFLHQALIILSRQMMNVLCSYFQTWQLMSLSHIENYQRLWQGQKLLEVQLCGSRRGQEHSWVAGIVRARSKAGNMTQSLVTCSIMFTLLTEMGQVHCPCRPVHREHIHQAHSVWKVPCFLRTKCFHLENVLKI